MTQGKNWTPTLPFWLQSRTLLLRGSVPTVHTPAPEFHTNLHKFVCRLSVLATGAVKTSLNQPNIQSGTKIVCLAFTSLYLLHLRFVRHFYSFLWDAGCWRHLVATFPLGSESQPHLHTVTGTHSLPKCCNPAASWGSLVMTDCFCKHLNAVCKENPALY